MKLLKKILVPVDVNRGSTAQMLTAAILAGTYRSEVTLLYVIPDEDLSEEIRKIVVKAVADSLDELRSFLAEQKISVMEPMIEFGKPSEIIVQTAVYGKFNLILAGADEQGSRNKFKLGVIAEQIIRQSDLPVWVVKAGSSAKISGILCPIDFSEPSKRALFNAILLARQFNARLNILTVYEPITYISRRINVDLKEENARRLKRVKDGMAKFIEPFNLNGVDHAIEIKTGVIHEKILAAAKKHQTDLLVMGTHGRSGLSRFIMGSVTGKVTREMPCSFVTTRNIK